MTTVVATNVNKAKTWLESLDDKLIIFDKALNAKALYKTAIPILERKGTIKEEKGRKVFTPNNPEKIVTVVVDHLLLVSPQKGRTKKEEMDLINPIIEEMPNIIEDYLKLPFDNVMNKYN